MRRFLFVLFTGFVTMAVRADNVVLVAGGGETAENVAATKAKLGMPFGVEFDSAGNLYFVEIDGHRTCRIDKTGLLTRIAGTTVKGLSDGGGKPLGRSLIWCDGRTWRLVRMRIFFWRTR